MMKPISARTKTTFAAGLLLGAAASLNAQTFRMNDNGELVKVQPPVAAVTPAAPPTSGNVVMTAIGLEGRTTRSNLTQNASGNFSADTTIRPGDRIALDAPGLHFGVKVQAIGGPFPGATGLLPAPAATLDAAIAQYKTRVYQKDGQTYVFIADGLIDRRNGHPVLKDADGNVIAIGDLAQKCADVTDEWKNGWQRTNGTHIEQSGVWVPKSLFAYIFRLGQQSVPASVPIVPAQESDPVRPENDTETRRRLEALEKNRVYQIGDWDVDVLIADAVYEGAIPYSDWRSPIVFHKPVFGVSAVACLKCGFKDEMAGGADFMEFRWLKKAKDLTPEHRAFLAEVKRDMRGEYSDDVLATVFAEMDERMKNAGNSIKKDRAGHRDPSAQEVKQAYAKELYKLQHDASITLDPEVRRALPEVARIVARKLRPGKYELLGNSPPTELPGDLQYLSPKVPVNTGFLSPVRQLGSQQVKGSEKLAFLNQMPVNQNQFDRRNFGQQYGVIGLG
jgi:hypothetical protein